MRYIIIGILSMCCASAATLDSPIVGSDRDQILLAVSASRTDLSPESWRDLGMSVREIELLCDGEVKSGISKEVSNRHFVLLVDGRTPRQIILTASLLMLVESSTLGIDNTVTNRAKLRGDELSRQEHLEFVSGMGVGFTRRYADTEKKNEDK